MKKPPSTPEFAKFTQAMKAMMRVSKTEMQRRIEEDKAKRSESPASSQSLQPTSPALIR